MAELHELVMAELRHGVEPMAGAPELLAARCACAGTPVGLASNSPARSSAWPSAARGLAGCFDVVVSGDEVERPKPAPDVYLAAAGRGSAPSRRACVGARGLADRRRGRARRGDDA